MVFNEGVGYQQSHEWARKEEDLVVVGITDYAQDELGDVVFVQVPEVGTTLDKGEVFGAVESVKAASDLYMPMGGEIVAVNAVLEDEPEKVNEAPFDEGWMIKFKPTDPAEYDALMDAAAYKAYTESPGD